MTHTNRSQRIYSALVWLYPASFRSEYGECLEGAFEDLRREASVAFSITALALGGVQWWVLRRSHRQAQSWIAANVGAAPVACFAGLPFLSGALGLELMSAFLIVNVVVMSTLGVMTASSIDRILGHPRQPEPTLPDADLQVASD